MVESAEQKKTDWKKILSVLSHSVVHSTGAGPNTEYYQNSIVRVELSGGNVFFSMVKPNDDYANKLLRSGHEIVFFPHLPGSSGACFFIKETALDEIENGRLPQDDEILSQYAQPGKGWLNLKLLKESLQALKELYNKAEPGLKQNPKVIELLAKFAAAAKAQKPSGE